MAAVALLSGRYIMEPITSEPPPPLVQYLIRSLKVFFQVRALALAGVAYVFFFLSLGGMSNLSLYTKEALGRDPKDFSGLIMALRFGFKCIAGYVLGVIAHRWGIRGSRYRHPASAGGSHALGLGDAWVLFSLYLCFAGSGRTGRTLFSRLRACDLTRRGRRSQHVDSESGNLHCSSRAGRARSFDRQFRVPGQFPFLASSPHWWRFISRCAFPRKSRPAAFSAVSDKERR